jgi:hypothetical protein
MRHDLEAFARLVALVALGSLALGCASSLEARPAPGFVEVVRAELPPDAPPQPAPDDSEYDFRAVAPEGVAFAAREVEIEKAPPVAFWENAVRLRMQEIEGYEFLSSSDAKGKDGKLGRELVFGHDEAGKAYLYRIRLFVESDRLLVLEAGGPKDEMLRLAQRVDWMFAEARLR